MTRVDDRYYGVGLPVPAQCSTFSPATFHPCSTTWLKTRPGAYRPLFSHISHRLIGSKPRQQDGCPRTQCSHQVFTLPTRREIQRASRTSSMRTLPTSTHQQSFAYVSLELRSKTSLRGPALVRSAQHGPGGVYNVTRHQDVRATRMQHWMERAPKKLARLAVDLIVHVVQVWLDVEMCSTVSIRMNSRSIQLGMHYLPLFTPVNSASNINALCSTPLER